MRFMKRLIFAIPVYLMIVLTASVCRADISVNLKLDRSETLLTDSVQLIVSVSGSRDSGSTPDIKGLENFDVRSTGTASRLEFINGKMTSGVDYTYFIFPQKIGKFQIGPARLQIKDKTYSSNTAGLRVVKPAEGNRDDRGPIFLTAELSNDTVYVEEQTIYILKLHLQRNVKNINLNLPEVENLTFKQLAKPVEYRSTLNGRNYQVLEVRYTLVPSRAGSYAVDPARMSMTVLQSRRRSNRSIFDDPFSSFASGRPANIASESLTLTVRSLPEEGKPPDFSGLVGKFEMKSKLDPIALKTGESATLTVSVSGRGNVNRIPDPNLPELTDVKIYADQPVLESTQDRDGLRGTKTMKWALVPEKDGNLTIPPVSVSFFDTENHVYKTLKSSSHTLSVLPGKEEKIAASETSAAALSNDGTVKQTVMELGRDIFPVHTAMQDFKTVSRLQRENWFFGALAGLPLLFYLGILCAMKLRRSSKTGQADMMAKKAARKFSKQYRKSEHTAAMLLSLIRQYLNNRFGLSYGSLTPQEAFKILTSQGVGTETAEKMQIIMQQLENAEYTGKGMEAIAIDTDLAPFIKRIEKESR
jgi:hypothetical protein